MYHAALLLLHHTGPARNWEGERMYGHWFDGDGMVGKVREEGQFEGPEKSRLRGKAYVPRTKRYARRRGSGHC